MENETKEMKFRRLAEKRTNDVISRLRLIGNLANRKNYNYSDEQVAEMFKAIESELKHSKKEFADMLDNKDSSFSFSKGDYK